MTTKTCRQKYTCSQCNAQFSTDNYLKLHIKTVHLKEIFQCTQCDYRCNSNNHLETHVKFHSKNKKFSVFNIFRHTEEIISIKDIIKQFI
jgi:uncharacterized Zn-finger protein